MATGISSDEIQWESFKDRFRNLTGLDLDQYKEGQMMRRIGQWMERVNVSSYRQFIRLLESDSHQKEKFLNYLTINTSHFFRDPEVFERLKSDVIPGAVKQWGRLRIWSAGCSIGAEAYTLAIIFRELGLPNSFSIVATDVDDEALSKAKNGEFSKEHVAGKMEPRLISKYFTETERGYKIDPELGRNITFRKEDLFTGNGRIHAGGYHIILCRNVFIYFKPEAQNRLLSRFIDFLRPSGYYVTGCTEHVPVPSNWGLSKVHHCIYQKTGSRPAGQEYQQFGTGIE